MQGVPRQLVPRTVPCGIDEGRDRVPTTLSKREREPQLRLCWRVSTALKCMHYQKLSPRWSLATRRRSSRVWTYAHNPAVRVPIVQLLWIILAKDAQVRSMHDIDGHPAVHFVDCTVAIDLWAAIPMLAGRNCARRAEEVNHPVKGT